MKNIFLILIISVLLTACSNVKYTQEEVKYLETMVASMDSIQEYLGVLYDGLSSEDSEATFKGMIAIATIAGVVQDQTPPEKFKEIHDDYLNSVLALNKVCAQLGTGDYSAVTQKKFELAGESFQKSMVAILKENKKAQDIN
ncbi:hypothetical protein [Paenibacillus guangzhouensis]|uniref:hypothetical protein n=1 Tax=Paenibacillus guangzhouensis TaxID=1473112 RepID=UPI0012670C58|nr:hypothetical protein [Paenibacillus guangzhouensis]